MQIIIEGPDGSGKTTLLLELARVTGWKIVSGEGPEKYPGEMMERIERYLKMHRYGEAYNALPLIYDRHPCVSHMIYSQFTNVSKISPFAANNLYQLKTVIVYCQSPQPHGGPLDQNKAHDTKEHVKAITDNHEKICELYDAWAIKRAHIIHRFWQPQATPKTIRSIIAATGEQL